jgi:SAM-dependent methyltransferase
MSQHNASGLQCMAQGQFQEAILWFKRALDEIDEVERQHEPIVLFNLGNAYRSCGEFALAIEYFLRSLVVAPQYDLTRNYINECIAQHLAEAHTERPDIARLLVEFHDKMGWDDVLVNPSSTKEFLHFLQAARLCKADSIVLDISAGFGRNRPFFAHAQYVALDMEVATGWDFTTLDMIGDALNLPVKDNSIDLIISSSSLEHYTNPFQAFHEFARVLKPGGHLYLDAPFRYVEHQIPHDYYRFSRYGLNHLCQETKLNVVSIEPDCGGPIGSMRLFLEALRSIIANPGIDPKEQKILSDTLHHLTGTVEPMFFSIDHLYQRSGVSDSIKNCSQFPIRYNLVATKPGKLAKPKHYKDRSQLLQGIIECPACHQSGLLWKAKQCSCEKCGKSYPRNDSGIPQLLTA